MQVDFEKGEMFNYKVCPSAEARQNPMQMLHVNISYPKVHHVVDEKQEHAQSPR